jgi:2-hydroxymethylglutarate dehydrogenase
MKIGFIGLGAMGMPMAKNLLKDPENTVFAYDLVERTREIAREQGMTVFQTAREVAENAEILFLSLPNANIVEVTLKSIFTPGNNSLTVSTIADVSTIAPKSSVHFGKWCEEEGIKYMDCPVSGGVGGAEKGTLTFMVGGEKASFEKILPVLKQIGKNIYHMGDVGSGSAVKIVNNYILACNMISTVEGLILGTKMGLDVRTMYDIINKSSGRSFITDNKLPNFIIPRKFGGGFAINLQQKDLRLALDSGAYETVPLFMGTLASQVFESAIAKGLGAQDITSVLKIYEELIDMNVE